MKIKCPYCDINLGNADYRATVHSNAYHNLLEKIHEELESWKQDAELYGDHIMDMNEPRLLKSLLENEK